MLPGTPRSNIEKYFDSDKAEREGKGINVKNNNEMKKTDNNTPRTNKEQTNYNNRYIRPNHNALFGFFVEDQYTGSILPERRVNTDRNQSEHLYQSEKKQDKPTNDQLKEKEKDHIRTGQDSPGQYSSLRRGIDLAQERLDIVNNKVEALDSGWRHIPRRVGEVETGMASKGRLVDEMEQRNKLHSARIHDLERELKQVQLENRAIKGHLLGPEQSGYGHPSIPEYGNEGGDLYSSRYDDAPRNGEKKLDLFEDFNKERYVKGQDGPMARNEQYNSKHVGKITDEKGNSYYGLNKIYDPNSLTSYRSEQVPYLTHKAEKDKEEEFHERQRDMEGKLMREEAKLAVSSKPYDNLHPPKDINKYFHHHGDRVPEQQRPAYEYERQEALKIPDTIYQKYYQDYEFKHPEMIGYANASAGGLSIIRFHNNSFADVNTALHLLQRQLSVSGGRVGMASSPNVMVLHGSRGWRMSKDPPRPQIACRYQTVHDAILAIWFPSKTKASELFRAEHKNRFRDQTFLMPYGYDSTFVPLNEVPRDNLDGLLVLEVENAKKYQHLQEFEADSRTAMLKICPRSQPYVCSMTARTHDMDLEGIKPGPIFRDGSRVFISAFEHLADVAHLWNSGMLYDMLDKYNIRGDIQAFAFSMKDNKDHFSTPHWR